MSAGYAAGIRQPYAAVPVDVSRWVERWLGTEVVEVRDIVGGMSPGPVARLRAANGRRVFVKTCGSEINPHTPDLLRTEARVLAAVPVHASLPVLHDVRDDGDWVTLLIEDIEGQMPTLPWRRDDLGRVSATLSELREVIEPAMVPGTTRASESSPILTQRWRELVADPGHLDRWWLDRIDVLAAHAERAAGLIDGNALLHWDIRADNMLFTGDRTVVVDWGQVRVGALWMDHMLLALDCSMSGSRVSTAEFARTDPVLRELDPATTVAITAAVAMSFLNRARLPVVPSLPTLNDKSRRWAEGLRPFLAQALAA